MINSNLVMFKKPSNLSEMLVLLFPPLVQRKVKAPNAPILCYYWRKLNAIIFMLHKLFETGVQIIVKMVIFFKNIYIFFYYFFPTKMFLYYHIIYQEIMSKPFHTSILRVQINEWLCPTNVNIIFILISIPL